MNVIRGHSWLALLILSVLALSVGLFLVARGRPRDFGWFAYAPLSDNVTVPFPPGPLQIVGLVLAAAGFGVGCGLGGYRLGRRRGRP